MRGWCPRRCSRRRRGCPAGAPRPAGSTTASRGSSRGSTARDGEARRAAPPACPCCCGRRGRPRGCSSASSISFTNSRLPPTSDSGALRQPVAGRLDDDDLARRSAAPASISAATVCACHSASWLPRVPRRRAFTVHRLSGIGSRAAAASARESTDSLGLAAGSSASSANSRVNASAYVRTRSGSGVDFSCSVGVMQQLLDDAAA